MIRSVCVFCGSRDGDDPRFAQDARRLGRGLAEAQMHVVYGGTHRGLMGAVADAALDAGGRVTGVVIDRFVQRQLTHHRLSELEVHLTLAERKARMAELSDAFVVLPGGHGTFDELFDMVCLNQLDVQAKPVVLVNTAGFYSPLLAFLEHATRSGFVYGDGGLHVAVDVVDAIGQLQRM